MLLPTTFEEQKSITVRPNEEVVKDSRYENLIEDM